MPKIKISVQCYSMKKVPKVKNSKKKISKKLSIQDHYVKLWSKSKEITNLLIVFSKEKLIQIKILFQAQVIWIREPPLSKME
jgi:hypothetical protein